MKISYVCPTNCVRRPIAELSILLAEKDHEVSVYFPYSASCSTTHWIANQKIEAKQQIKKGKISGYYFSSLRYNLPKPYSMLKAARDIFKSDVVHLWEYWYPLSVFVILYAYFTGQSKKLTLTTDGFVGYSYKPKKPWWLVPVFKTYTKTIGWFLFRMPGKLTTYGSEMLPFAREAGVPMNRLIVQGTGIHLDKFSNIPRKDVVRLRDEFSVKENEKVMVYVGMVTERKGILTIINVATQLLEKGIHLRVFLVGDLYGEDSFVSEVPEKYQKQITFTGGRQDVPLWMNLADVLLLPSDGEGLPGVVMEAMAASTACVATNEGCTPDLIDNAVNGFLVEFGDVEGYAEAVNRVLCDTKKYGEAAFLKIQKFGWEKVAGEYLELYNKEL
jgi:glycosyltransferase involved in cell wall biosynthesis